MENFILQVILFQLLFLLVYEILLKKETFFNYNRWYLLLTAAVSLFLPFIKINAFAILDPAQSLSGITNVWLPEVFIGAKPEVIEQPTAILSQQYFTIDWWFVIYGIGLLGSLMILIRKYQNLERLFKFKKISAERDFQIIEIPNSSIACTFYKTIFLGDKLSEAERQHILIHELVHVKQKHSLDLVFFEILKIIFWFNPLIYIFQNKITTLHEFIADADAVKATEKANYYEQLLNTAFNTKNISFINQFFNHSLIKKRIVMLQKSRSKTIAKFKYLFIVPIIVAMLTYVACSEDKTFLEERTSEINPQEDEALKAALWEEITAMDKQGVEFQEISKAFVVEEDKNIKSKEGYYRMQTMMRFIYARTVEKEKAAGTYDENKENPFQSYLDQDYNEYVAKQKQKVTVKRAIAEPGDEQITVPFAVIDEVSIFPGCEDLGSNQEKKDCMSLEVKEHVNKNFNTAMGKELGLTGVNRIITVFTINKEGAVTDIRARAPHPDLEVEAVRVISTLPLMTPGKQGGVATNVVYSLPIVFQVNE